MEKRDAEVVSTAGSICKEMQRWPFVVSTIVWYNVLFQINKASKTLQTQKVCIETVRKEIRAVTEFLQEFWDDGFNTAKTEAREIAEKLEVEMSWPEVRQRRTTQQFEYEGKEQTQSTAEEIYKREFFLSLIDKALITLKERFSHMETFYELYGFLYSTDVMRSTEKEGKLDERCHRLEQRFDDVDAEDLKLEHHNIEDSSCCCPNLSCVKRAPCLPLPWAPNFLNPPLLAALHEDMPHSLLFLAGFTESIFVFSNF